MEKDIIMSLVWVSIHCESKFEKKKNYKPGKGDVRIPVLQKMKQKGNRDMNREKWF